MFTHFGCGSYCRSLGGACCLHIQGRSVRELVLRTHFGQPHDRPALSCYRVLSRLLTRYNGRLRGFSSLDSPFRGEKKQVCCMYNESRPSFYHGEPVYSLHNDGEPIVRLLSLLSSLSLVRFLYIYRVTLRRNHAGDE
jgi:hypothetical protein